MSISIVNGYVCASCADVSKAKRGENPAKSEDAASASPTRLEASLKKKSDGSTDPIGPAASTGQASIDPIRRPSADGRIDIKV